MVYNSTWNAIAEQFPIRFQSTSNVIAAKIADTSPRVELFQTKGFWNWGFKIADLRLQI